MYRKLIALLLLAAMLLMLCACATGTPPEATPSALDEATKALIGSWRFDVTVNGNNLGMEGFESTVTIPFAFSFDENRKYRMTLVEDEAEAAIRPFNEALEEFMINQLYQNLAADGMDKDAADAAFSKTYNMTIPEYAHNSVEAFNLLESFRSLSLEGIYYVMDGKLYISDSGSTEFQSSTLNVTDTELTLLDSSAPASWEALDLEFPVVMTRIP